MAKKAFEFNGEKITRDWVNKVVAGEKAQRDRIQTAIIATLQHGLQNSYSFDLLTQLVLGLKENGGRNLKGIMTYISKTCQGIHWIQKENRFGAVKDKSKVVFKELDYPWYLEGKIAKDNKLELYDINSSLKVIIGKLKKVASGEAKDKSMTPVQAKATLKGLEASLEA